MGLGRGAQILKTHLEEKLVWGPELLRNTGALGVGCTGLRISPRCREGAGMGALGPGFPVALPVPLFL